MNKSKLKDGDKLTLRNGMICIFNGKVLFGDIAMGGYNNDLTHNDKEQYENNVYKVVLDK